MVYTFIVLFFSFQGFAEEPTFSKKEIRKYLKEMKMEKQAEEAAEKASMISYMIENQRFVLEAEKIRNFFGQNTIVSSQINYIANDSITGIIQIGRDKYVGLKGVGGITVEGLISNYEYQFNQISGVYNVNFRVSSITGTYYVRMSVLRDGRADAILTSDWPVQPYYTGTLVPPSQSMIY